MIYKFGKVPDVLFEIVINAIDRIQRLSILKDE